MVRPPSAVFRRWNLLCCRRYDPLMNHSDRHNVQFVTNHDLCIGCGACVHACPYHVVQVNMDNALGFFGAYRRHNEYSLYWKSCTDVRGRTGIVE